MKASVIITILLASVALISINCVQRMQTEQTDLDMIQQSLTTAKPALPAGPLSIQLIKVSDQCLFFLQYALPAQQVAPGKDTLLLMYPVASADSVANIYSASKLLWQNQDDKYAYWLIAKQ